MLCPSYVISMHLQELPSHGQDAGGSRVFSWNPRHGGGIDSRHHANTHKNLPQDTKTVP